MHESCFWVFGLGLRVSGSGGFGSTVEVVGIRERLDCESHGLGFGVEGVGFMCRV